MGASHKDLTNVLYGDSREALTHQQSILRQDGVYRPVLRDKWTITASFLKYLLDHNRMRKKWSDKKELNFLLFSSNFIEIGSAFRA